MQFHETCNIREVTSATLRRATTKVVRVSCRPAELPKDTVQLPAVKVVQLHELAHSLVQIEANNNRYCNTVSANKQHLVCTWHNTAHPETLYESLNRGTRDQQTIG
jgi:hypothetical protein